MPLVTIKIELDVGTMIGEAFKEAIRLSKLLNVKVEFDFNEVVCISRPFSNRDSGVLEYRKALKNKIESKGDYIAIAFA